MKLPSGVTPYLEQVADDTLTTLAQLQDALAAVHRAASLVNGRISVELAELDGALHEIVARVIETNHAVNAETDDTARQERARALGDDRRAENLLENCAQRSRFVQSRLQDMARLIVEVRRGVTELQNDQAQLRAESERAAQP